MRGKSLRQRIFSQGSAALAALGNNSDVYCCPICTRVFSEESIENGGLTLEDVPPKSVGGRPIILTCRRCNNFAGHTFDNHAKLRSDAFIQAEALSRSNEGDYGHFVLGADGAEVNVDVSFNDGTFELSVSNKNNPIDTDKFSDYLRNISEEETLTLSTGKRYIPSKAALSDQKTAFLILTAKFGYTYALNERTREVRNQIRYADYPSGKGPLIQYIHLTEEPENTILVDEKGGMVLLRVLEHFVCMPWISLDEAGFEGRFASKRGRNFRPIAIDFPSKFEAVLDHTSPQNVRLIGRDSNNPKSDPQSRPG